jgi:hypothetical protein
LVLLSSTNRSATLGLDVCSTHDVISSTNRYRYVPDAERT